MPTITRDNSPELANPRKLGKEMLKDLLNSRELAWRLFLRDFKARYRQSLLGYFWVLFPPLALTFSFLLLQKANLLNVGEMTVPYPIYALTGMVFWQTFTEALMAPIRIMSESKSMLIKLNFPRESLILSGLLQVSFTFSVRILILIPCLILTSTLDYGSLPLLPIAYLGTVLLGTMFGVLLSPISVLYQDIAQGLPLLLSLLLIMTPVAYLPKTEGIMGWLNLYNPAASMVLFGRDTLLQVDGPPLIGVAITLIGTLLFLFLGWVLYRISIPHLISRIGA